MKKCGIYALYWEVPNLIYIGLSQDIDNRFRQHSINLCKGKHRNHKVQSTYFKYGLPEYIVLEECSVDNLQSREEVWTNECDSLNSSVGLNITYPGRGPGFGVYHGNSKYSRVQILKVFALLTCGKKLPAKVIATRAKVSIGIVYQLRHRQIHTWLCKEYPDRYLFLYEKEIFNNPINAHNRITEIKFISPKGEMFQTKNVSEFARTVDLDLLNGSKIAGFNKLASGKMLSFHGWSIVK